MKAFAIPKKNLNIEEVVIIGLTAAATFAILDVFSPLLKQLRHQRLKSPIK